MGLYEIENIDNPDICTIAINPKNLKIEKLIKNIKALEETLQEWTLKVIQKKFLLKDNLTLLTTIKNLFKKDYKLKHKYDNDKYK